MFGSPFGGGPFGPPGRSDPFAPLAPGDPRIRVGNRLMWKDQNGGLHLTRERMWGADAGIEEAMGRQACQRMLDKLPPGK